jgi:hypothetical protein
LTIHPVSPAKVCHEIQVCPPKQLNRRDVKIACAREIDSDGLGRGESLGQQTLHLGRARYIRVALKMGDITACILVPRDRQTLIL